MWSALHIPLQDSSGWQVLSYQNRPKHKVEFAKKGLSIQVRGSAGPLVYSLGKREQVRALHVHGRVAGELKMGSGLVQGESMADDFVLRLGVVLPGVKHLTTLQRWMAPDWIRKLHALSPQGLGIDHIEFFNFVQQPALLGRQRRHPKSELLEEHFQWLMGPQNALNGEFSWPSPQPVIAIWLAVDGDDTHSDFTTEINDLTLDLEVRD